MRDIVKSIVSFSWALSFFGIEQARSLLTAGEGRSGQGSAERFDRVARAAEDELGSDLRALYRGVERLQRQLVDACFLAPPGVSPSQSRSDSNMNVATPLGVTPTSGVGRASPGATPPSTPDPFPAGFDRAELGSDDRPVDTGRLGTISLVVLGDALPAGMGDFAVFDEWQQASFAACVARQMKVELQLPRIQAPGIGAPPGIETAPIRVPASMQTTVREDFPPQRIRNFAVPGFRLVDLLEWRPHAPMVSRTDPRATAGNLMLGLSELASPNGAMPATPVERALSLSPSLALVCVGYEQVLQAAVSDELGLLPSLAEWRGHWQRILSSLVPAVRVVVTTVPNPLDTPACASIESAARTLKLSAEILRQRYHLDAHHRLTVRGLWRIAYDILNGCTSPLPIGCTLSPGGARQLADHVTALNDELRQVAATHDVHLFDLAAVFRRFGEHGLSVAGRTLTSDFLGGLFTLNGAFPGCTAHAAIANDLLSSLNGTFGAAFPAADLDFVAREDPVALQQQSAGRERPEFPIASASPVLAPRVGSRGSDAGDPLSEEPPKLPLRLPPGLEQTLPLSTRGSYHGDAIRIVHCLDPRDRRFGSCPSALFGGLVMFDSHLHGDLRIRFSSPIDDVARFEISFDDLAGDDADLAAPDLFRWPVKQCRVRPPSNNVSSGSLNLTTGEVSDLQVFAHYENSALAALAATNPTFPRQPIGFPGEYGSAWARFDQRPDGNLDFTFYGSTFIPLEAALGGPPARWALPFCGDGGFSSIPASGMALHPHLNLTTREPSDIAGDLPVIRPNVVRELTLFTRQASFGDKFTLNSQELGGEATGRSHLMGRLEVQFGPVFGESISIAVSGLPPGGLLAPLPDSPLASAFPGRLPPGPLGHDEHLRFPLRNYFLDGVALVDDPFDLAIGAIDLKTGRLLNSFLRRGFIAQDLFYALIRVEPRTPQSSFYFRGPALIESAGDGGIRFRFRGGVAIPYPEGFRFPTPDLTTSYTMGPHSRLDPFVWLQAVEAARAPRGGRRGAAHQVRASNGEMFSYSYRLPADPARETTVFQYENHTQDGVFRLHRLSWFSFTRSRGVTPREEPDVSTFSGFGTWSKDPTPRPHIVTVQIADGSLPYVSVQIDGGLVSNVNTRPATLNEALP